MAYGYKDNCENKRTDGRYQVHYLPRFAVDKNLWMHCEMLWSSVANMTSRHARLILLIFIYKKCKKLLQKAKAPIQNHRRRCSLIWRHVKAGVLHLESRGQYIEMTNTGSTEEQESAFTERMNMKKWPVSPGNHHLPSSCIIRFHLL